MAEIPASIRVDFRPDAIAVLTFDQPGSRANILTKTLWTELQTILNDLASRTDVKGLILRSAKPEIFIAGADLKFIRSVTTPNDSSAREFIEQGLTALRTLEALSFPTCAIIQGTALGGGLEVALACDFRVCSSNPRIELGLPEVNLGLIPGWGGTQRLPRIVPWRSAAVLLRTGAPIHPPEALSIGLVQFLETDDRIVERAVSYLQQLNPEHWTYARYAKQAPLSESEQEELQQELQIPEFPPAPRAAMDCLRRGSALSLHDAIAVETTAFQQLCGSEESQRLIQAFFDSRKKN